MDANKIKGCYQKVYDCVGPVRSAVYEALFFLTDDANRSAYASGTARNLPGAKCLDVSLALLKDDFDTLFADVRDRLPESLISKRHHTTRLIEDFIEALSDRGKLGSDSRSIINGLAETIQSEIRPVVTEFLSELEEFAESCMDTEERRNRAIVDGAITDIENINSTINLIAINASVEAALAGDAGRGFAVIAAEIQDLSQKSKRVVEEFRGKVSG